MTKTNEELFKQIPLLPKDITSLLKIESKRYRRKGFGFFLALTLNLIFFGYGPIFFNTIWPSILEKAKYY